MGTTRSIEKLTGFRHTAVFYDGVEELCDRVAPFVREGVRRGDRVLVAELPTQLAALQDRLGDDAAQVRFVDMAEVGQNPACIIPVWQEFLAERPGVPARGVGEPAWAGRRAVELEECQLHEALLNVAFDAVEDFQLLCPYDVGALPSDVVTGAMRTHPDLGAEQREASYAGHDHAREVFTRPLPEAPRATLRVPFGAADLGHVRKNVRFIGEGARLAEDVVDDLALAVHELACNSIEHGGGGGVLRAWTEPDSLVVEVSDAGVIDDPLVGREQAMHFSEGGRGIWIANRLCDLVQVRSSSGGTTVRLHTWL